MISAAKVTAVWVVFLLFGWGGRHLKIIVVSSSNWAESTGLLLLRFWLSYIWSPCARIKSD